LLSSTVPGRRGTQQEQIAEEPGGAAEDSPAPALPNRHLNAKEDLRKYQNYSIQLIILERHEFFKCSKKTAPTISRKLFSPFKALSSFPPFLVYGSQPSLTAHTDCFDRKFALKRRNTSVAALLQ